MLSVVLVRTRNPLNIGAAARAMSNFGVYDLRLVAPYEPSFKEARSAVGAAEVLSSARVFATLEEAISDCRFVVGTTAATHRELHVPLLPLDVAAEDIRREIADGHVALLFGSEKTGLAADDLDRCHRVLRIPTGNEHVSMNLGQAVALCLYELARTHQSGTSDAPRPTVAEMGRLHGLWLESLSLAGYVKPRTESATDTKLRQLLRRLEMKADDAELVTGMFRKIRDALLRGQR